MKIWNNLNYFKDFERWKLPPSWWECINPPNELNMRYDGDRRNEERINMLPMRQSNNKFSRNY